MRNYTKDEKFSIECSAPIMFFDITLPSGRKYSKEIAKKVVEIIQNKDIPVRGIIGDSHREIGIAYVGTIIQSGVVARMALKPGYAYLENVWNMEQTMFSAAIEAKPPTAPSVVVGINEFVNLSHIEAFLPKQKV